MASATTAGGIAVAQARAKLGWLRPALMLLGVAAAGVGGGWWWLQGGRILSVDNGKFIP